MSKIIVIGIDSATFDIIEPLVNQGKLPVFARFMKEGVWGRLRSTIPPVTPPAWTSFMTGKNPGKHGIFDFYGYTTSGYERPVINSQSIKSKTLWRILSEKGKTAGVVNVPLTYPPEEVNGYLIPGMQYAFNVDKGFTYPKELLSEIEKKFGKYEVIYGDERSLYTNELDHFVSKWKEITRKRQEVILYLLDKYETDFFMAVFYSIDPIQHHFWKFYDRNHPQYDKELAKKYGDIIPEFYQLIDANIGQILDKVDKNTTVFVVSDHGAGSHAGGFFVNKWLMKKKLLKIKKRYYPLLWIRWPHIFFKIMKRLGHPAIAWTIPMDLYNQLKNKVDPREGIRLSQIIDWKKTKAYAGNYTEQGIYINLKGREVDGIVDKDEYPELKASIADALCNLIDPKTKTKVVDTVLEKEEVYHGPYGEFAPDLFVLMKGGDVLLQKDIHRGIFSHNPHISGTHRMDGIFIAKGGMLNDSLELENLNIVDIAPTILYLLGVEVPEDMDGRVLKEIIKDDFLKQHPVKYGHSSSLAKQEGSFDEGDANAIREKLRNLGYA
ncbi:MAG: alkaline phosphatase family protein [Candidatus Brocadia sp.]|nr:alkaline phosphatase family protein [Candidatus Brocadia sp.]